MAARLLLVGCGKMGSALLAGWLRNGHPATDIAVVEPAGLSAGALGDLPLPAVHQGGESLPDDFRPAVVVLAVKPQAMDAALPPYRRFVGADTVFLSIAAGKTIGYFEKRLGAGAAIVRSMPNTPAAVGRGITVAVANPPVGAAQRALCETLLSAVGEVGWVDDEALLDPVTGVSGSGPAYVFLLVECLAEAGVEAGLPPDLAARLARCMVSGAGELLHQADESPTQLRQNVTSPAGTTEAALQVLMAEDGLQPLITRAVAAATRRSRELAD